MIEIAKGQLYLIPVKFQSEFACPPAQKKRLDALIDETFTNMGRLLMGKRAK